MSRVIALLASGFALASCSGSMPSIDFLKGSAATEVLRVESEPPGADARTTQGESCRTPCELTVPSGGDFQVSYALNGYQPQSVQVHPETGAGSAPRLQPNPVYAELQPVKSPAKKKKSAPKARTAAKSQPAPAPADSSAGLPATGSSTSTGSLGGSTGSTGSAAYPWPDPQR